MPTWITGLSSVLGNFGKLFGGGAPNVTQNTSVSQNVAQSQQTNVGSNVGGQPSNVAGPSVAIPSVGGQQDLANQLAYLLGASPVAALPPTTGGNNALLDGLYSSLGVSTPPTTTGVGDSRYAPLGNTGTVSSPGTISTASPSGIGINGILIFVAIGLVVLLVIKKMKRSK